MGLFPSVNKCRISYSNSSGEPVMVVVGVVIYERNNFYFSVVIRDTNVEDSSYLV